MSSNLADLSRHLLDWLTGTKPESEPLPQDGPSRGVETMKTLEDHLSAELRRLQQEARQAEQDSGHATFHTLTSKEQEAALVRERDVARSAMRDEIYALHERFGTGLTASDLDLLQEGVKGHEPPRAEDDGGVDRLIERAVCQSLLRHAGHMAWERLLNFMQTAGLAWPPYPELTYGRAPDEIQSLLEAHHQEIRARLCGASLDYLSTVMVGEIRAWPDYYPTSGARVWRETCLVGVAAALQIQVYSATVALWLERPAELQASIVAVLQQLLLRVKDKPEAAASSLCNVILDVASSGIPDLVWKHARPRLVWESTPVQPQTIRDLATRLLRPSSDVSE